MKTHAWLVAITVLGALMSLATRAQTPEPAVANAPTLQNGAAGQIADAGQVPVADQITEYRLPPDLLAKSESLYRTRLTMFVIGTIYGLAVLVGVLALRIGPRFRDLAERTSQRRFVQVIIFAPLLLLTIDALSLPLGLYGQHLQREYGLSVQSWGSWVWDWSKGEIIGTVIGTLLIWGLYALLRRSPTRWWFYAWLVSIPVVLLLVLIQPIFLDPLFNKFDSLEAKQPQLLEPLEKVMQRGGLSIERSRMFEMQASDKVTSYNAYVTGIGASKRVVVWDNTSRDLSIPETMFVFGHELGHYVLDHIWKLLAFLIGGLFIAFYAGYRSIGGVLERFGGRWGIRYVGDWASLPALLLLFSVFSLAAQPVSASFSRTLEHQADIFGLEVIHDLTPDSSQVAAHAFQKLGEKGLSYPNPNPFLVIWLFDHPPLNERIKFAAEYRPWEGGTPEFVK
jgi:Zn-dependent protease with chaperone function